MTTPSDVVARSDLTDRYRLLGEVATTAEGVMYAAEDLTHERPVALLILHAFLAGDAAFMAAVEDATGRLTKLTGPHPTLADTYECGTTETGEVFLAAEPVGKRSLRHELQERGTYDALAALRLAIQVGEALEVLHRAGIVHGELRPETVFLVKTADGLETVKVADAHLTTARRTPAGAQGRDKSVRAYLAPEQRTEHETTEAADVYALGILLSELLTGERAGGRGSRVPRNAPAAIQRIVAKAVDPRPAKRYSDIGLMLNEMWTVEGQLQRSTGSDRVDFRELLASRVRTLRPNASKAAVAAAAVLVVSGLGAWMVFGTHALTSRSGASLPKAPVEASAPAHATPRVVGTVAAPAVPSSQPTAPPTAATPPTVLPPPPPTLSAPDVPRAAASSPRPRGSSETPSSVAQAGRVSDATSTNPSQPAHQPRAVERVRGGAADPDGTAIIDWLLKERR